MGCRYGIATILPPSTTSVRNSADSGASGGIFMAVDIRRLDEAAMWRILERYPYSPEGTIIRLAWLQGLSRKELNELTWTDVDFEGKTIILADRTIPMEESTALCLKKRFLLYGRISDRAIIADRGKKPMTPENVSRLARLALESKSLNVSLMDLRHDWLLRQVKFNGWAYAASLDNPPLLEPQTLVFHCLASVSA